jgi:hypothetical protein
MMITEIRIYNLKENTSDDFYKIFMEYSLPMLKRWNVNVLDYGFSLIDESSFYLMRNYESVEQRKESQESFYGSDEWKTGVEESVMSYIESYHTVILDSQSIRAKFQKINESV